MRFLYTADWHLGRQFHKFSLLEDQRHALAQLVAAAADNQAQAFVIAGDVFDRAVPSPEAVALLDECLAELVLGQGSAACAWRTASSRAALKASRSGR